MFRQVIPLRAHGLAFDMPVLSNTNILAVLLSAAAVLAIFRFNAGVLATLGACSVAGIMLYSLGAI